MFLQYLLQTYVFYLISRTDKANCPGENINTRNGMPKEEPQVFLGVNSYFFLQDICMSQRKIANKG